MLLASIGFLKKLYALQVAGKGYFSGGNGAGLSADIDGINFVTETSINPAAAMATLRDNMAGVSSSSRGYFCGGALSGGTRSYEIDGIQFSDESAINPAVAIVVSRSGLAGINSSTKGYLGGGINPSICNEIDGILFSNESSINPSATLVSSRVYLAGTNSSIKGYFMGGGTEAVCATTSTEIDGILFSDDTAINPSAVLATARYATYGASSSIKGYSMAGKTIASGVLTNEVDGILFSNDTAINPASTLIVSRYNGAVVTSSVKGYYGGGYTTVVLNSIEAISFDTDTISASSATLVVSRTSHAGVQSYINYESTGGITGSGYIVGSSMSTKINGFSFMTETNYAVSSVLTYARNACFGNNSTTRGYFGGGRNGSNFTYFGAVDRIQFSDNTTGSVGISLSARAEAAPMNSMIKGYWGGGLSETSLIDGIIYSTEAYFNAGGLLAVARRGLGAYQSATEGYCVGGYVGGPPGVSEIDGLTFATNASYNPSTTLLYARYTVGTTSSSTYGYTVSGTVSGAWRTDMEKYHFVNQTSTTGATVAAALGYNTNLVSNNLYAYANQDTVSAARFTFSTDTMSSTNSSLMDDTRGAGATCQSGGYA